MVTLELIKTGKCFMCNKETSVTLTSEQADTFRSKGSTPIQDVLPELSVAERELLISGCHADCW